MNMPFSRIFILLVVLLIGNIDPMASRRSMDGIYPRELSKLLFTLLNCTGPFDKGIFAEVNNICVDCYEQYRSRKLFRDCRYVSIKKKQQILIDRKTILQIFFYRNNCYTNSWYENCTILLHLEESTKNKLKVEYY